MQVKHLPIQIEKGLSGPRFILSASSADRVGDTIDPAAYKAIRQEKLIALWQHNPDQPVGYWHNIKADGARLVADLKLASTNLAKMIGQLLDDGVPLGASIGFRGKGEPNKKGIHFKEIELLETSIVSIPCNPAAVRIAKHFGLSSVIDETEARAVSGSSCETVARAKAAILAANRAKRI